jgi:hypothetical protein
MVTDIRIHELLHGGSFKDFPAKKIAKTPEALAVDADIQGALQEIAGPRLQSVTVHAPDLNSWLQEILRSREEQKDPLPYEDPLTLHVGVVTSDLRATQVALARLKGDSVGPEILAAFGLSEETLKKALSSCDGRELLTTGEVAGHPAVSAEDEATWQDFLEAWSKEPVEEYPFDASSDTDDVP